MLSRENFFILFPVRPLPLPVISNCSVLYVMSFYAFFAVIIIPVMIIII